MAFIRRRPHYQLVAPYREGGKVRQRVASLGEHPTVEEALHAFRKRIANIELTLASQPHREAELVKARGRLARLEAVVSTTSTHADVVDTTSGALRASGEQDASVSADCRCAYCDQPAGPPGRQSGEIRMTQNPFD